MNDTVLSLENIHLDVKFALSITHDDSWHETKAKAHYALWIILSGSLTVDYGSEHYDLSEGDVFFFYPQILYQAASSTGCSFHFIHFDAVLGNNCQALHFFHFDGCYPAGWATSGRNSLTEAVAPYQKQEPFAEWALRGALSLYLANIMKMQYQKDSEGVTSPHNGAVARLQPVLIYINHHLAEQINIPELADYCNLSEKYFITFFRKVMGVTPSHFITQVKMKKALEYLHEQNYSVKEVAGLVGYTDSYTFSRAFKKIYGISPSKL